MKPKEHLGKGEDDQSKKEKESLERSAGFLKVQNCNVASRGNRGENE